MASTVPVRTVALIAVIGVLLPLLAFLQYQWLGELSGLEQMRVEFAGKELVRQPLVDQDGPGAAAILHQLCGVIGAPVFPVRAEIIRERFLTPRTLHWRGNGRESRDRTKPLRMFQANGQCAMATHGMAE